MFTTHSDVRLLRYHWPEGKLTETEDPDVEDDMYAIDKERHIQIGPHGFGYARAVEDGAFLNWHRDTLAGIIKCALKDMGEKARPRLKFIDEPGPHPKALEVKVFLNGKLQKALTMPVRGVGPQDRGGRISSSAYAWDFDKLRAKLNKVVKDTTYLGGLFRTRGKRFVAYLEDDMGLGINTNMKMKGELKVGGRYDEDFLGGYTAKWRLIY